MDSPSFIENESFFKIFFSNFVPMQCAHDEKHVYMLD